MISVAVENQNPGKEIPPRSHFWLRNWVPHYEIVFDPQEKGCILSSKNCALKDQCCLISLYQNFTQVITDSSHQDTLDNSGCDKQNCSFSFQYWGFILYFNHLWLCAKIIYIEINQSEFPRDKILLLSIPAFKTIISIT